MAGCFLARGMARIEFVNCLFESCWAVNGRGGAVETEGRRLNMVNCTFVNNRAQGYGGGVCSTVVVLALFVANCVAFIALFLSGGAMVNDSVFYNNSAIEGGAMYSLGSSSDAISIDSCEFAANTASSSGGGTIDLRSLHFPCSA